MTVSADQRKTNCRVTDCAEPTDLWLCNTDTRELETALGDMPFLLDQLTITATRQARAYRAGRRATAPDEDWRGAAHALPSNPLPMDLAASDLRAELGNTLSTWARHIVEARDLRVPELLHGPVHGFCEHGSCDGIKRQWERATRIAAALRLAANDPAAFLLSSTNSIRLDEAAGDLHHDITRIHHRAHCAIDRSPSRVFAGPCHAQVNDVVTEDRDGTIWTETVTRRCDRDVYAPGKVFDADWLERQQDRGVPITITCDGWSPDGQRDGCGTVHDVVEREVWLIASLDGALVPLAPLKAFAQRVLNLTWPPASTVRSWLFRDRLVAQGVDRSGVELFDASRVLELVRDDAGRPGRKTRRTA